MFINVMPCQYTDITILCVFKCMFLEICTTTCTYMCNFNIQTVLLWLFCWTVIKCFNVDTVYNEKHTIINALQYNSMRVSNELIVFNYLLYTVRNVSSQTRQLLSWSNVKVINAILFSCWVNHSKVPHVANGL